MSTIKPSKVKMLNGIFKWVTLQYTLLHLDPRLQSKLRSTNKEIHQFKGQNFKEITSRSRVTVIDHN